MTAYDAKPHWGGGTMARLDTAHLGGPCRVCGEPVPARVPAWHVPWVPGVAHEMCGYLRGDEEEPHRVGCEGRFWWRWRCPDCKLDATSDHEPREGDPRSCSRCYRPTLVVGSTVEARAPLRKAVAHRQQRSVFVRRGERGMVTSVGARGIEVRWEQSPTRPDVTTRVEVRDVRVIR